jgi:acetyltransferase (GNAT) family protein
MADSYEIRLLESGDVLDSIYGDVLTPAFTPDELEPLEDLRGYLESDPPEAFGLYAVDPSGGPIGCCIYYPYPEANALLLGYMAVVADERSRGTGTRLFEESRKAWFGSGEYDLVLTELDDPRVFPVANGIDPERRIKFYSARGGRLICGPYFAPCVRPGGERVYDMLLVALGGSPRALHASPAGVSAGSVAAFLREYFSVEEGLGDFDNGDLHWLMEAYKGDGTVPMMPVADYRSWDAPRVPSRRSG